MSVWLKVGHDIAITFFEVLSKNSPISFLHTVNKIVTAKMKLPLVKAGEDGCEQLYLCWSCKQYCKEDAFYKNYLQRRLHYCKPCHRSQVRKSAKASHKKSDVCRGILTRFRAALKYYKKANNVDVRACLDLADVHAIVSAWEYKSALSHSASDDSDHAPEQTFCLTVLEQPWPHVIHAHHVVPVTSKQYRLLNPNKNSNTTVNSYKNQLHAQLATNAHVHAKCAILKHRTEQLMPKTQ